MTFKQSTSELYNVNEKKHINQTYLWTVIEITVEQYQRWILYRIEKGVEEKRIIHVCKKINVFEKKKKNKNTKFTYDINLPQL